MSRGTEDTIGEWLAALGLEGYAQAFADNNIDIGVLAELTADDLKEIGVSSVGHRRRILTAIEQMADRGQPASARQDGLADTGPGAERRLLTVMFCDLVGSTELSVGMDPEEYSEQIGLFRQTIEGAIAPYGAHVAQYAGDGLLAYFGYPNSTEHDAERAIEASLAAVDCIQKMAPAGGFTPRIRIGLATGIAVVGGVDRSRELMGDSAVGETLNLAARLQSLAGADEIVISQSTRRLVGEMFNYRNLGTHALKGFAEPVEAWQVFSRKVTASRFEALRATGSGAFIGREEELKIVRKAASDIDHGGRFFRIVGEAGIGKSRFVRQALITDTTSETRFLVLQCSPYQSSSPFYPLRYMIERTSGLTVEDTPEARISKMSALLQRYESFTPEHLAVFAELSGISHENLVALKGIPAFQRRKMAITHLCSFFVNVMRQHPYLLFEDIQWIDPSTSEVMDLLLDRLERMPVIAAVTMQPGPSVKWLERERTVSIHLDRLSNSETRKLVRSIVSSNAVSEDIVNAISERCDGVPIFAEELARGYLSDLEQFDHDFLSHIPATLAESVLARIDRLNDGRRIASIAAAIGREFPVALLIAVSGLPEGVVRSGIRELLDAGIMMPGYSSFGEAVCFRQMLVRDAAYHLLLRRDRKALHLKIVSELRERFPVIAEALPHTMALQLGHAGEMTEATSEWLRAGNMAMQRSAYGEAIKHLRSGLEANSQCPPGPERNRCELALRTSLLGALIALRGYGGAEVREEMEKVAAAGRSPDAGASVILALYAKWVVIGSSGNIQGSAELAHQMRELAQDGTEIDRLIAHRTTATTLLFAAKLPEAIEEYHKFLAIYDEGRHADALRTMHGDHSLMVMLGLAEAYALAGKGEEAQHWRSAVLAAARQSRRAHDIAHILAFAGCLHPYLTGDHAEAARNADELVRLCQEHDLAFWLGHGTLFQGLGMMSAGDSAEGVAIARQGIQKLLSFNAFSNAWYVIMAAACLDHGTSRECADLLAHAAKSLEMGDLRFAPEYHRVRAELLHRMGEPQAEIVAEFRRGIALAEEQGTLLFLPALTSGLAAIEGGRRSFA